MSKETLNENRFTFWQNYYDTIRYLPNDEVRLRCYEGLLDYMFADKELPLPQEDPEVFGILNGMKVSFNNNKKYIKKQVEIGTLVGESNLTNEATDDNIAKVMIEYKKNHEGKEIKSKELGAIFGLTDSAIRKKEAWIKRNELVYPGLWFKNKGDIKEGPKINPFNF